MMHLSVRKTRDQSQKNAPCYFAPRFLDEEGAGRMWHHCIKALEKAEAYSQSAAVMRVGAYHAQIHAIYNGPGRLVRFWLRTVIGNHLVIVGNRDGLLPLDVESIHG
jgi:hypothetical protein